MEEKDPVLMISFSYYYFEINFRGTQRQFRSKYIENTFKAIQSTFRSPEKHSS